MIFDFLKSVIQSYVKNLSKGRYIFSTDRINCLSENKQAVATLFDNFKKISSYVY